jgi:cytochrome P450
LWPAPRRFDPDRFAGDPTAAAAGKTWAYLPFGGGPHLCIGKHFALLEVTIVLTRLAQRGRLVAPSGPTRPSRRGPRRCR